MVDPVTTIGIVIIFVGIALILLATFLRARVNDPDDEKRRRTEVKGGGVVLIGPIPIVIGSDAKWASVAILLAIVLLLLSFFIVFYGVR